jgi:hypothetical protein
MSYPDPDFVITSGGRDVTKDVISWQLKEVDDGTSTITFAVSNQDLQYAGVFKPNTDVTLIFGYENNLSPKITMNLKDISLSMGLGVISYKLVAYDNTEKLCGQTMQGAFKRGTGTDTAAASIIKNVANATPDVNLESPKFAEGYRLGLMNMLASDALQWIAQMSKDVDDTVNNVNKSLYESGQAKQGDFKGVYETANTMIPSQGVAKKDNADYQKDKKVTEKKDSGNGDAKRNLIDTNRAKNVNDQQHSETITAQIKLLGYPSLKAAKCVTILNACEFSGDWYVSGVVHQWSIGEGFVTLASLKRGEIESDKGGGGGKKGKSKASRPMTIKQDIYASKPKIYVGPRRSDAESQATFTYGEGKHLIDFNASLSATQQKSGGEEVAQKTALRDVKTTSSGIVRRVTGAAPSEGNK